MRLQAIQQIFHDKDVLLVNLVSTDDLAENGWEVLP